MEDQMKIRKCSRCKEEKPIDSFRRKNGYIPHVCDDCRKEYQHKYYKLNAKKGIESAIKWKKDNPEKVKGYVKKWQKANPEKCNGYKKKWKKDNPEKVKNIENKQARKGITDISDRYVKRKIYIYYGVKNPPEDLIRSIQMRIKVKRLLKSKKNENNETS